MLYLNFRYGVKIPLQVKWIDEKRNRKERQKKTVQMFLEWMLRRCNLQWEKEKG